VIASVTAVQTAAVANRRRAAALAGVPDARREVRVATI
jgi:hypothetical protein